MNEILPSHVNIVLADRTVDAEVVEKSPQAQFHSDTHPALIVKIEGVLNTFAHKSLTGEVPFWDLPGFMEPNE